MIKSRVVLASKMIFASIVCFFFVGIHFELFDNKIDFIDKPATFLFFSFLLFAVYWGFYIFIPQKRLALLATGFVILIYILLFVLGKISRGEF